MESKISRLRPPHPSPGLFINLQKPAAAAIHSISGIHCIGSEKANMPRTIVSLACTQPRALLERLLLRRWAKFGPIAPRGHCLWAAHCTWRCRPHHGMITPGLAAGSYAWPAKGLIPTHASPPSSAALWGRMGCCHTLEAACAHQYDVIGVWGRHLQD